MPQCCAAICGRCLRLVFSGEVCGRHATRSLAPILPSSRADVARWLLLAVLLGAIAACSRSSDSGHPGAASEGALAGSAAVLVRGGGAEPDTLDPQKARSAEAQTILRDICEGLTVLDKHGEA